MDSQYDFVIVGGGSAGCVLANRLSSDPHHRVVLIEAGADTPPESEPVDVLDTYPLSSYNASYFWPGLRARWRPESSSRVSFAQARIMGGGSSVAGMVAFRGTPDDYNEWQSSGARGWGWDAVLPYFRRLENDQDFAGPMHGGTGPVPIRRIPAGDWPPLSQAIARYAESRGMPFIADMNGDFRDGFGATPISSTPTRRVSTAAGYLTTAVRQRKNLRILDKTTVRSIQFSGTCASGVLIDKGDGTTEAIAGRQIMVAAGAIHSPALLLRSGIGSQDSIGTTSIARVADRTGVGQNLQNHAAIFIGAILHKHARQTASLRTHPSACLRLSSALPEVRSDIYINIQSKTSWNAAGLLLASLNAVLLKPRSAGSVRLDPSDPSLPPLVDFAFATDPADVERLAEAVQVIAEILRFPAVREKTGRAFVVRPGDRIRKWNAIGRGNAVKARAFATALDMLPRSLADSAIAHMTGNTMDIDALCADHEPLLKFIKQEIAGVFHPVGTCRMGATDDPLAVVDTSGRVLGVQGLRVVDASIMPTIPRGNTNIPTIMVAEKLSEAILRETIAA